MHTRVRFPARPAAALCAVLALILPSGCSGSKDDAAGGAAQAGQKENQQSSSGNAKDSGLVAATADPKTIADFVAPYLLADHAAALAFEPQRVIHAPVLQVIPEEMREQAAKRVADEFRIDFRKMERLVTLLTVPELPAGSPRPAFEPSSPSPADVDDRPIPIPANQDEGPGPEGFLSVAPEPLPAAKESKEDAIVVVIRLIEDVTEEHLRSFKPYDEPVKEMEHNGRKYFQAPLVPGFRSETLMIGPDGQPVVDENGELKYAIEEGNRRPAGPSYFQPDKRTVVFAYEKTLKRVLEGNPPQSPLRELLAGIQVGNGFTIAATAEGHAERVEKLKGALRNQAEFAPPPVQMAVPLAEKVQGLVLVADLTNPTMLRLALEMKDDAAAKELWETADGGLGELKKQFAELRKGLEENPDGLPFLQGPDVKEALDLAARFVDGMSVTREGSTQLLAELERPAGLDEFVKAKAPAAIEAFKEQQRKSAALWNLKQVALAMHIYYDTFGSMPPAAPRHTDEHAGKTSWRVYVLPFVEEIAVYDAYHFNEPWDSERNKGYLARMPAVFDDETSNTDSQGRTRIALVTGPGTAWEKQPEGITLERGMRFQDIIDGTAYTIMLIQLPAELAVPWTAPQDFVLDPDDPFKGLGGKIPDEGLIVVTFDGAVHTLPPDTTPEKFKALCTHAGGEIVAP